MQAIGETLSAFVANHGPEDFDGFVLVLAERLIQRDRADAAEMIGDWRPVGFRQ
jgi:hypothetical protein